MDKITLQLFIAGRTPRAERAIATLQYLRDHELAGYSVDLLIIDVLTDPQQAEARKILATPTLIKLEPGPPRRIIGDLANSHQLLEALSLQPRPLNP